MNRMHCCLLILAAGAVSALTGCNTVPYTGRSQLLITSESQERELGVTAWNDVRKTEKESGNQEYNAAVTRVGKNIATSVNRPDYSWEFKVFESKVPNAFCLPGGKVAVYSGLFTYTANDAELAAVIGHAAAHAIARHGGERISQAQAQQVGASILSATVENAAVHEAYGIGTNVGVMLPYSRTHEYEADYLGLIFMAQAGYDPNAAVSFWEKFGTISQSNFFEELFSTHPAGDNRVEELKKKLPEAMAHYQKAPQKLGLGRVYGKEITTPKFQSVADKTFGDTNLSLQFQYPGDWMIKSTGNSVQMTTADQTGQIYIQNVLPAARGGKYGSVEEACRELQAKLQGKTVNCKIANQREVSAGGCQGLQFNSEFELQGKQYKQHMAVLARPDGSMFHVYSYMAPTAAYEVNATGADRILTSLKTSGVTQSAPAAASPAAAGLAASKKAAPAKTSGKASSSQKKNNAVNLNSLFK